MRRINVLQIISSSDIGGAEKIFCSLLERLDKDKFDIYAAAPADGPMFNDFKRYAQEMRAFDFKPMFSGVNAIGSLKDYMREKKIDIVHTHLYGADFIGTIAAMLAGVPYKISTVHGYNFNALDRLDLRNMKNFVCSTVYRGIYIPDDEVIAVSEAVKRDLAERPGIRVRKNKIRVIYDGIDLEMPRGIGEDRVHEAGNNFSGGVYSSVGMIANFDRIKGHHIMLKAIPIIKKELKNVRFLFAGQGKERSRLEQMALRLGVAGDIIFEDAREDINGIISQCDLIVSPSLSEGLSLAVLEAMALAKPVVAADIGGIPEAVEDGKTGLLVPPRDHRKLAEAVIYLLMNKGLAMEMGRQGRARAQNSFALTNMIQEVERVYLRLAEGRPNA